jgi:hypothetical protein
MSETAGPSAASLLRTDPAIEAGTITATLSCTCQPRGAADQAAGRDRAGEQFLHGERQPVAVGEQPADGARHLLGVEASRCHPPHRLVVQPPQLDAARGAPGRDRPEQVQAGRRLAVPDRRQADHVRLGQVVGEVLHDRERLGVRPVQILEHEQRALGAGGREQPDQGLADDERRDLGRLIAGHGPLGNQRGQRGQVIGHLPRIGNDPGPGELHQRLGNRPERNGNRRLGRAPDQDVNREP